MNKDINKNSPEKGSKKRSLKGMTLIEVIIAMVVLVIVSTMAVVAATSVLVNMRTSKSVIKKVDYQSPIVASDGVSASSKSVKFSLQDSTGVSMGKEIAVPVYESPVDPAAMYGSYDKAGNLKYFTYS